MKDRGDVRIIGSGASAVGQTGAKIAKTMNTLGWHRWP